MKHYEMMYITDPSNEDGIEDVKKRIEGIITGREGSIASYQKIGKKRLAYPIVKHQYGIYFLVNFHADGRIVQALDYFLRLSPVVLRHLILSFTEKQLTLKQTTDLIQKEEAERMRMGGKPLGKRDDDDEGKDVDNDSDSLPKDDSDNNIVEDSATEEKSEVVPDEVKTEDDVKEESAETEPSEIEPPAEAESEQAAEPETPQIDTGEKNDEKEKTAE